MIASAAAGIISMRFNKRMTEANRPVLGASVNSRSGRYVNTLSASASAKENDWQTAIEILDAEIRRACVQHRNLQRITLKTL